MKLHGLVADSEAGRDRLIGKAFRQQTKHVKLAGRQRFSVDQRVVVVLVNGMRDNERVRGDVEDPSRVKRRRLVHDLQRRRGNGAAQTLPFARRADEDDAHSADRPSADRYREIRDGTAAQDLDRRRPADAIALQ